MNEIKTQNEEQTQSNESLIANPSMRVVDRDYYHVMILALIDVTKERTRKISEGFVVELLDLYGGKEMASMECREGMSPTYRLDINFMSNHKYITNNYRDVLPPSNVIRLGQDPRGYNYVCVFDPDHCPGDRVRIVAGCRNLSLEDAKIYWANKPEVLPRILMAEQIAIHRGWLKQKNLDLEAL